MSFRHHLALFKDHSCLRLPTIARHCPLLPAKKMSQAVVASQYGGRSRGPGRVPRAAPRQPGCTVEPTNHEPRPFLARGASRREFRGFHESRVTKHESRPFFAVGAPGWRHRKPPSGPLRPPASRLARAGMLEQYVEHGKQAQRSPGGRIRVLRPSGGETCRLVSPRRPDGRSRRPVTAFFPARRGAAMARHGRHIAPAPVSARRPPFSVGLAASVTRRVVRHAG